MARAETLSWLQTQYYSLRQRIRNLVWAETAHSRGKTTAKSRGGSFSPKERSDMWKIEGQAGIPLTPEAVTRDALGLSGPTFINQATSSRTHNLSPDNVTPAAVYDRVRKNLVRRFGVPYIDPITSREYWHGPALGQMELPAKSSVGSKKITLIQYPVIGRAAFEHSVRVQGWSRAAS